MENLAKTNGNAGSSFRRFYIFLAGFYAAWILRVVLLLPVDRRIDGFWLQQCWSQGLRIAIWVVPVLLYLRLVDGLGAVRYLKLDTLPRGRRLWIGVAIVVAFFGLTTLGAVVFQGGTLSNFLHVAPQRWIRLLSQMTIIAFAEELLFRGFVLTKLSSFQRNPSNLRPNLIASCLFLLIHVPGWLYMQGPQPTLIPLAASIFFVSCVLGLLFQITRSLWPPVLLHLLNNVLSATLLP
jgi:membrane protease YdiL (CAAX protease family)